MATRISGFAHHSTIKGIDAARDAVIVARTALADALVWLSRYESDKQADDADRATINECRTRLKNAVATLNTAQVII